MLKDMLEYLQSNYKESDRGAQARILRVFLIFVASSTTLEVTEQEKLQVERKVKELTDVYPVKYVCKVPSCISSRSSRNLSVKRPNDMCSNTADEGETCHPSKRKKIPMQHVIPNPEEKNSQDTDSNAKFNEESLRKRQHTASNSKEESVGKEKMAHVQRVDPEQKKGCHLDSNANKESDAQISSRNEVSVWFYAI